MKVNMAIKLFKRDNGIYYVEINRNRRSLGTRSKTEATRLYNKVKREYLNGKIRYFSDGACSKRLGEFQAEYLEWAEKVQPRTSFRCYKLALSKLVYFAGSTIFLDRVSHKHIDEMIADCRERGLQTASINNYIRHIRATMNKAVDWEYVKKNPLAGVKELPAERKPFNIMRKEHIPMYLASIRDVDLRRLVVAYLATGRRRGELLRLQKKQVELENDRYLVEKSKRHLTRWYPINGTFRAVLVSIGMDGSPNDKVFPRWKHPDTVSKLIKKSLRAGGYPNMRLHDLRHTFISIKAKDGLDLKTIQELAGHTDVKTTMLYTHVEEDHIRQASEVNLGPVDLTG